MKSFNIKFLSLLVGLGFLVASCDDYLDVNSDPNQSTSSRIDLQLSSSQLYIGNAIGDRLLLATYVWCQYYSGGPGVALGDPDQHKLSSSECNQLFRDLYRSNSNLKFILDNSTEKYYQAIAKILTAYNISVCVDLFGDVPYTEALKGDIKDGSNFAPKYDNAKDVIYPDLEKTLTEAIALFDAVGFKHPAGDDLIYGGDLDKWKKFANSLLLKLYIRQGDAGQAKVNKLFASADQFITTNADNAKISYPGGSTASNPYWQEANSSALGNYYVGTTTCIDHLLDTKDPRIDYFFNKNKDGIHIGLKPGDIQNAPPTADFSKPNGARIAGGGIIFNPTAPVILMSSWEVNLLIAEAAARGWIGEAAQDYYNAAVYENAFYLGLDSTPVTTYLTAEGAYKATEGIKSIAVQKWTCMNGLQTIESWIETRRFDNSSNPIFSTPGGLFSRPTNNALGGTIFPSIMPYPESEESLNKSFPGQHSLTSKVFWDN